MDIVTGKMWRDEVYLFASSRAKREIFPRIRITLEDPSDCQCNRDEVCMRTKKDSNGFESDYFLGCSNAFAARMNRAALRNWSGAPMPFAVTGS